MQRLYENHKVLTYPRTDSRYLSSDVVPTIKDRLRACGTGPYRKLAGALLNQNITAKPSFVDDRKVSDHHAIIPTEQYVQLDHMTVDERRIYDLVVRRFLAVLYPPVSICRPASAWTWAARHLRPAEISCRSRAGRRFTRARTAQAGQAVPSSVIRRMRWAEEMAAMAWNGLRPRRFRSCRRAMRSPALRSR